MTGRTALLRRSVTAALALVACLATVAPPVSAAGPQRPDRDPFYSYAGRTPLADVPPGTVLRTRTVQLALGPQATPVSAEQLLYRTTSQLGRPTVTVTTVLTPTPAPVVPQIVGYLSFYDGLGSQCDPSYTLAGGDPGAETRQQAEEEEMLMLWYLSMGWVVTVPDFEGTRLAWMAGRESGYGTLDAIRATESYLKVADTTKVGLSGYSGGALAADWASELAPAYAPELDIVGVAAGGVPVDQAHLFDYVNGDDVYSSVLPGMLLGLARGYHLDLRRYLSPYGARLVRAESHVCIASVFGDHPGLRYQRLMKPRYRDLAHVAPFRRMLREQRMGTVPGHPAAPLFLAVGNADGKGDGVMRADDLRALAREYCAQGVPVQLEVYDGADHTSAGAFFDPATGPFLQSRFAGAPFTGNC
jgi:hypothetical protein